MIDTHQTDRNGANPDKEVALINKAAEYLNSLGVVDPDVAVILGSGLGNFVDKLVDPIVIPYGDIPGFAVSTAPGHAGSLYFAEFGGKKLLVMAGRVHFYEGYSMQAIVFPVRVMAALGIKRLIITNAAGAINPEDKPGSLMLIHDHINLSGSNPLIGPNLEAIGTRFPDMTTTYDEHLRTEIKRIANSEGIELKEGVYAMMTGPSFETPAEIRFLRAIGADAAGMSSVPEAIAARHAGLEIVTISCLSNAAAGVLPTPISGDHVNEVASKVAPIFARVVEIAIGVE